jgi:single-strand DNA-binding protein
MGDNRLLLGGMEFTRRDDTTQPKISREDQPEQRRARCREIDPRRVWTMADLNKVFLMGSLTFDPELRRTPGGTAVSELRMVTSRTWMSREGERREEKLFIDVTVWDRQAENCCQYLHKGSPIHVEGALKMDTWEDKSTGEKRSKIRVHADRVQFLEMRRGDSQVGMSGGPDDEGSHSRDPGPRRSGAAASARGPGGPVEPRGPAEGSVNSARGGSGGGESAGADEDEGEDIPF